jgi:hypothetical protein
MAPRLYCSCDVERHAQHPSAIVLLTLGVASTAISGLPTQSCDGSPFVAFQMKANIADIYPFDTIAPQYDLSPPRSVFADLRHGGLDPITV